MQVEIGLVAFDGAGCGARCVVLALHVREHGYVEEEEGSSDWAMPDEEFKRAGVAQRLE